MVAKVGILTSWLSFDTTPSLSSSPFFSLAVYDLWTGLNQRKFILQGLLSRRTIIRWGRTPQDCQDLSCDIQAHLRKIPLNCSNGVQVDLTVSKIIGAGVPSGSWSRRTCFKTKVMVCRREQLTQARRLPFFPLSETMQWRIDDQMQVRSALEPRPFHRSLWPSLGSAAPPHLRRATHQGISPSPIAFRAFCDRYLRELFVSHAQKRKHRSPGRVTI